MTDGPVRQHSFYWRSSQCWVAEEQGRVCHPETVAHERVQAIELIHGRCRADRDCHSTPAPRQLPLWGSGDPTAEQKRWVACKILWPFDRAESLDQAFCAEKPTVNDGNLAGGQ